MVPDQIVLGKSYFSSHSYLISRNKAESNILKTDQTYFGKINEAKKDSNYWWRGLYWL